MEPLQISSISEVSKDSKLPKTKQPDPEAPVEAPAAAPEPAPPAPPTIEGEVTLKMLPWTTVLWLFGS